MFMEVKNRSEFYFTISNVTQLSLQIIFVIKLKFITFYKEKIETQNSLETNLLFTVIIIKFLYKILMVCC